MSDQNELVLFQTIDEKVNNVNNIMLSTNFKEECISGIKDEIREMSQTYRDLFGECSVRLEKMGNSSLEANVVKGLGTA